MLAQLKNIDPSKNCLKFLHDRVLSNNYRGNQISQHNRYSFDQVVGMLKIFYDLVGKEAMKIRTTDLSKRPHNTPDEAVYAEYTNLVNDQFGKSTQDSIRKNLFVDFHRMGLINRYGINGELLDPYDRRPVRKVSLSKTAIELINPDSTLVEKYMVFSRCLDNIMLGLVTDLFDVLAELDHLTLHEYTFFISFARNSINDRYYSLEDMILYAKEYRSMSRFQKNAVVDLIQIYCNPLNFHGDKTQKRDYHNWINETQQVFTLLNMTAYYEYNSTLSRIQFMVKSGYVFNAPSDLAKLKRSISEKKEYFKKHSITKTMGFELHHIVPLLWAKTNNEFFLLDKWQNMLYIDGKSHSIITQKGNKHVEVKFLRENDDIRLYDYHGDMIPLKSGNNVLYNSSYKKTIYSNNKQLLKSF